MRTLFALGLLVAVACEAAPAGAPTPAATQIPAPSAAPEIPLFDAHLHYSAISWPVLSPEQALELLATSGVRRALVSSTPDDGTLRLYERAPDVVVPILRPYRNPGDIGTWTRDETVIAYLEERLARGIYRGIGELHLSAEQTRSPVVRRVVELAVERGVVLQVHGDDRAVEELLALEPRLRILWAHAGMSAGPERVRRLLERSAGLVVELALRSDVAPDGLLDPDWRELFLRYPERFLIGTDTWVNQQWERYADIQREKRFWLGQLPREVAEQIAYRNGERVFAR